MTHNTMQQVARFWNTSAWDFDSIYTGAGKNAWTRALDRIFRKDIYQRFDWAMDKCGNAGGKTICDLGCGSGRFVAEFARRGALQVTGVDVAPTMLRLAAELVEERNVGERCDFVLSDVLDWDTRRTFDITLAMGLWDYIADPLPRLQRIRALTRDVFLSSWPRFWTWRMPLRKVRLQGMQGCPVYFYRQSSVRDLLTAAGFEIRSCEVIGQLFCVEARPQ